MKSSSLLAVVIVFGMVLAAECANETLKCIQCGELGQGQCPIKGKKPAPKECPENKRYGCEKCINEYGKTTRRCVGPGGDARTLGRHKCEGGAPAANAVSAAVVAAGVAAAAIVQALSKC